MEGKNFLKVTGILMIIGGAIAIITSVLSLITIITMIAVIVYAGFSPLLAWITVILAFGGSILELIAGIMGVKYCDDPQKAKMLLGYGVIIVAICILNNIIGLIIGAGFSVVSLLVGLVIPILYIIGASKNMKSA